MIIPESEIIPYAVSPPPGERVLVLAPHPDDESLGCGGAIRLLVESGKKVKVLFLTSGDKADPSHPASQTHHGEKHITDYAFIREREAVEALRVLEVTDYEFLRFPDREVNEQGDRVFERLLEAAEDFLPDAVYSPSCIELNPDHRAAAELALRLQGRIMRDAPGSRGRRTVQVVFCEVTTPLRPNLLVDITPVIDKKHEAIRKYRSQLGLIDYLRHITALNTFRSLTAPGADYAEAYWTVDGVSEQGERADWLGYAVTLTGKSIIRGSSVKKNTA